MRVVVGFDESRLVTGFGDEQAGEVDHLVTFDGTSAALVLPVHDVHDDVHDVKVFVLTEPVLVEDRRGLRGSGAGPEAAGLDR